MSLIRVRVLSRSSAAERRSSNIDLWTESSMSMKSITMMPPMSRSRSCRTVSSAASRLVLRIVSSRLFLPTNLPVLTSTAVSASVLSIVRYPPLGQRDRAPQRRVDRPLQVVRLEERGLVAVELDLAQQLRRCPLDERDDLLVGRLVVDDEPPELLGEHVAHQAQGEVHLGVDDLGRERLGRLVVHALPQSQQELEVGLKVALGRPLRNGAHDDPHLGRHVLRDDRVQTLPLAVGHLLGDADELRERHQHQEAARQRDLGGDAGALGAHRVLGDLHHHLLAGFEQRLDVAPRQPLESLGGNDLIDVEEGVLLQADVHERGLHPRQHVGDFAQVDVADDAAFGALDIEFDQAAILEHRDAGLVGVVRDEHLAVWSRH